MRHQPRGANPGDHNTAGAAQQRDAFLQPFFSVYVQRGVPPRPTLFFLFFSPPAPPADRPPAPFEPPAAAAESKPVADQPEPAADASAKKDVDGLKVLVLCAGAGTSAMLANAIKEGAAQTGENIASSAGAYGQHTAIMDQYDVIVLAPQVRSYYNDMKADTDRLGIKLLAPRGKEYIDLTRDPAGAIKWLRENLD